MSSARRETRSAHTPDGISSTKPVTDQITNSEEIWAGDSPFSANSRAYTG